jgi:hypothetical protein
MTPLQPYPLAWNVGEALAWSNSQGWEGVPVVGSLAIQPVPHRVDEDALPSSLERWLPREGIPDLLVRCRGSQQKPSWHAANGLYGFVGLAPGPHTFTIEDLLGRYLPAKHNLTVIDRGEVLDALKRLERPTQVEDWRQLVHRLPLRPAPGAGRRTGSTGIWGELRDAAGRPIPFALVQVQTRFRGVLTSATTWTDASGGYALDLDGERPDPFAVPGTVAEREGRICLPLQPSAGSSQSWVERIPVLDRALVQSISSGIAPTGYGPPRANGTYFRFRDGPNGQLRDRLPLQIGQQERWDLILI